MACYLERQGLLERDVENSYLALEQEDGIESFPRVLEMLFNGGNTGKLIVKVGG